MRFFCKRNLGYIVFAFFIFLTSCEVDYKPEAPQEQRLVVESLFSPDTSMQLLVSLTQSPYEELKDPVLPDNIHITLNEDNKKSYDDFELIDNYFLLKDFFPSKGHYYNITVTSDNYKSVSAKSYIPENINLTSLNTGLGIDANGTRILNVNFEVEQDTVQYLIIRHIVNKKVLSLQNDTIEYRDTAWLESQNKIFEDVLPATATNKLLFAKINTGGTYSFYSYDGYYSDANLIHGQSEFEFISCSKDYYEYMKSLIVLKWNKTLDNNSIVSPISLYSNVKNGFGIFAGYNMQYVKKEFKH